MANETFWAALPARISSEVTAVQPLLPTYLHIIVAALFPIYAAAHASLSRPSSAASPAKSKAGSGTDRDNSNAQEEDEEDEDDEEDKPRMEGLSPSDAIVFPLTAGVALTALYFLIKWDKDLLNKLLNWYMSLGGLFGLVKFLSDGLHMAHSFCFPSYYSYGSKIWHVNQNDRKAYHIDGDKKKSNSSPLPGLLSSLPLPNFLLNKLWSVRGKVTDGWTFKLYIHKLLAVRERYDIYHFSSLLLGSVIVFIFTFVTKPWYLTNLMGFAFSYTALQLISPTTFTTGSLVLVGLFFYDIYMVFYTPMMVSVAKNLDIPIKLLFPRPSKPGDTSANRQFSMLGLGDIVLPGIVMGLALRFDLYLHYLYKQRTASSANSAQMSQEDVDSSIKSVASKPNFVPPSKHWSSHFWTESRLGSALAKSLKLPDAGQFSKAYFNASLTGYILGMIATLTVMQIADHAQPALLYLVPGVLLALWTTALFRGEIKLMWNFTEEEEERVEGANDVAGNNKSKSSEQDVAQGKEAEKKAKEKAALEKIQAFQKKFFPNRQNELVLFSIAPHGPWRNNEWATSDHNNYVESRKTELEGEPGGKRLKIA